MPILCVCVLHLLLTFLSSNGKSNSFHVWVYYPFLRFDDDWPLVYFTLIKCCSHKATPILLCLGVCVLINHTFIVWFIHSFILVDMILIRLISCNWFYQIQSNSNQSNRIRSFHFNSDEQKKSPVGTSSSSSSSSGRTFWVIPWGS